MNQQPKAQPATPIPAVATVYVTENRLEAGVLLTPPLNGGEALNASQILNALKQKGISYGILEADIVKLANAPRYNANITLALGQPSVPGDDASLHILVDLERDLRPKIAPDGSVDFRNLGIVQSVETGTLLCTKTPATPGTSGIDVFGSPVPPKAGKEKNLPAGRNTQISEDKLQLFAKITGQIESINNKINVLDTFVVEGNVSNATGNIIFQGNVKIKGDVLDGYSVQASGNVDIFGAVGAAKIIAGGSLSIGGGFNGGDKGEIQAGGSLTCKFIQSGTASATNAIETTYIYNAKVRCNDAVRVTGKGTIIGGHVMARTAIQAMSVGTQNGTLTVLEAGNDPILVTRSHEIPEQIAACKKNLAALEPLITAMRQLEKAGRLPEEKKEQKAKSEVLYDQLMTSLTDLATEQEEVAEKLTHIGQGVVRIQNRAFVGVKIVMGSQHYKLQEDVEHTAFKRHQGNIVTVPI